MRRLFKVLGYSILTLIGLIGLALLFIFVRYPIIPPVSDIRIETTPERLARGTYLFNHVAPCLTCHSERDWAWYTGPIVPGTEGKGAQIQWLVNLDLFSANITPHGLSAWTDGEIIRAITSSVGKKDQPLNPMMPSDDFAKMPQEDIYSLVVYLRSLNPVAFDPPKPAGNFLINLVGRILPAPYVPPPPVDLSDTVAYGKYLTHVASCNFCHDSDFSGGQLFRIPGGGAVRSANITPAKDVGIGDYSRDAFIRTFKSFTSHQAEPIPVPEGEVNTVMPWIQFSGMTEEDLGAIYDYLRTLPPVEKNVAALGIPEDN